MIDTPLSEINVGPGLESEALQQYVQALLGRQHALDLLEAIHQQTNDVWATIRRLLETTGGSTRTPAAVRAARAAEAVEAKNSYRSLEQRRAECIATLHQAELRANAALQTLVATRPQKTSRNTSPLAPQSRNRPPNRIASRPARQKVKNN